LLYVYSSKKKEKNRSHRETAQKHLTNCPDCKKTTKKEKFFSYTINPLLIQILKEKGYEDYVLFDEKNCCSIMSQQLLKAIYYLCKEYRSKSSLWYRNFLVKKFKKTHEDDIKRNLPRNAIDKIDYRFYLTYLSGAVLKNPIDYNTFINEKNKIGKYYKFYTQLDNETGSKTRLYNFNTSDYHKMKKNKKLKIMEESICYLDGEQKVRIVHKKDEKYNYKKALKRTENPKFQKNKPIN